MSQNAEAGPSNTSPSPSHPLSRSHSLIRPPRSQWYLHHLDAHILSSLRTSTGSHPSLPSSPTSTLIPPSHSLWTTVEKNLFFAALARYSRWRPELIAQEVGKTTSEVVWYLEHLEAGRLERLNAECTGRKLGEGERMGVGRRWLPGMAVGAREVSGQWVEKEEELAEGVRVGLEEREKEEDGMKLRKRRRREKRGEGWEGGEGVKGKDKAKGKAREVDDATLLTLERRWALEDWLSELSSSKLISLDLILDLPPLPSPLALATRYSHAALSPPSPSSPTVPAPPPKNDPTNKIARDLFDRDHLTSIPKRARTPEQRKHLAQILNRQSNRERYRTKKLVEEGWTVEGIEERGGADVIFAEREAGKLDKENREAEEVTGEEAGAELEAGRGRRKRKERDPAEEDKLRGMGMEEYLTGNGLELFSYGYMAKIMGHLASSTPPNLSATILNHLHTELLVFLKPLVYGAIVIAEQAAAQGPEDSSSADAGGKDGQASGENEDGNEGGGPAMSKEHVYQVLALSGERHPFRIIEEVLERIWTESDGEEGAGSEEDEWGDGEDAGENRDQEQDPQGGSGEASRAFTALEARRRPRSSYSKDILPPTSAPWEALRTLPISISPFAAPPPPGAPSRAPTSLSSLYHLPAYLCPPAHSGSGSDPESESELSDEEVQLELQDDALDSALDALDTSHDKAYEASLWEALESNDPKAELVDGDDSWLPRTGSKLGKGLRARTEVENAYMTLLVQREKARRKRAAERQREEARGRARTGRGRKIKSVAVIEDSESEIEMEEDG